MSTSVPFQPSTLAPPQFQATLAGQQYLITMLWNFFGQRFYVNVSDLLGNLIVQRPATGSGPSFAGVFSWDDDEVTATLAAPHNVPIGQLATIWVSQTGQFDGPWQGLSTGPTTLEFEVLTPPANVTSIIGKVTVQPINLVQGYLPGAWLLFHEDTSPASFEF